MFTKNIPPYVPTSSTWTVSIQSRFTESLKRNEILASKVEVEHYTGKNLKSFFKTPPLLSKETTFTFQQS